MDGSGEISSDELIEALKSLGFDKTRDEVQLMIERVDDDGTGQVGYQEFEDLLAVLKRDKVKEAISEKALLSF